MSRSSCYQREAELSWGAGSDSVYPMEESIRWLSVREEFAVASPVCGLGECYVELSMSTDSSQYLANELRVPKKRNDYIMISYVIEN